MSKWDELDKERRQFESDVEYKVWRRGGNIDRIDYDRLDDCFWEHPQEPYVCASRITKAQQPNRTEEATVTSDQEHMAMQEAVAERPGGLEGEKVKRFIIVERYADNGELSHCALVDSLDGRELGTDGGEPEDQSFWRDWSWVPDELNKLDALREENERLTKALTIIARYGADGICPYGCDTPRIAQAALAPREAGGQDE